MHGVKMRETTAFPHADIPEEGPALTPALCRFSRDDDRYWRHVPADHDVAGDFAGVLENGTEVEENPLNPKIGVTFCSDASATYEGLHIKRIREAAEKNRKHVVKSGHGLYGRPRKPATSGRKRKAA